MKKIIFILIILAVLLFSGCDAMLEVFYPEYADDNQITVYVDITTTEAVLLGYSGDYPLNVEIYKTTEDPFNNSPIRKIELMNRFDHYRCDFLVSTGIYDLWIWQDTNNSGGLNGSDFILTANETGSTPTVIFSSSQGEEGYTATEWTTF